MFRCRDVSRVYRLACCCNAPLKTRQSGPHFLVHLRKPRRPRAECDFGLRGEADRDCTPQSSEQCWSALLPSCDTPPSRLPPLSSCTGTVRFSCYLTGCDTPSTDGCCRDHPTTHQ